jgi:hypothetical protein
MVRVYSTVDGCYQWFEPVCPWWREDPAISILNLVPRGKPNLKIPSFTSGVNQRGVRLIQILYGIQNYTKA